MPLIHLLYRCPRCGRDPVEGEKEVVTCPGCGTRFTRGVEDPGRIRLDREGEPPTEVPTGALVDAIEALGGPRTAATAEDGRIRYEAEVVVRRCLAEDPVLHRGEVLGFVERRGEPEEGVLRLTGDALAFLRDGRKTSGWGLLDLRAIQASSSSLQISVADGSVVQLRFVEDSPRRWEDLLRWVLQVAYRREGRGEIVEYQPRIVTT